MLLLAGHKTTQRIVRRSADRVSNCPQHQFDVSQLGEDLISGAIPTRLSPRELRGIPNIDRVAPEDIVQGSVEAGERIVAVFDPDQGDWQELEESALILENEKLILGPTGTTIRLKLERLSGRTT